MLAVLLAVLLCSSAGLGSQLMHGKMRRALSGGQVAEYVFVADRNNDTEKPSMMMYLSWTGRPAPAPMEMGNGLGWISGEHDVARPNRFNVEQVIWDTPRAKREAVTPEMRGVLGIPTVIGRRSMLIVLVTIEGVAQECSLSAVRWHFHEQQYNLNAWFGNVSDGRIFFDNDLNKDGQWDIAEVTLPMQPSCTEMVIAARDAVLAAGVYDSTQYDHFVLVQPTTATSCGLAFATVGCDIYKEYADGCWASVSQCGQLSLTTHELGHNLGLLHGGIQVNLNSPASTYYLDYYDTSDAMGFSYWHPMHRKGYSAVQLWRLGLIEDYETRVVPDAGSVAQYGLVFHPYFGRGVTKLWRLGTAGNYFVSFRQHNNPGVDRHADMGFFPNPLGMPSATGQVVIYRWETDAARTSPDGASVVGWLGEGQTGWFDGWTVKYNWMHFSGTAAMISVGPDVWYYWLGYWPYYLPTSVDNLIVENFPQYYVWTESCREAPGEPGATFFSWNDFRILGPIPFDAAFYRSNLPVPQGSRIIKAEIVFEGEINFSDASLGFRQPNKTGGDGKLVLRTELVDNDNVWWALWAGPIHGLSFLTTGSDHEVSEVRGINEVAIDVTAAVQAFVDRPGWNPGGKALFRIRRADWQDPDGFVFSRGMCYNYWQCAPRLRLTYRPRGQKRDHETPSSPRKVQRQNYPAPSVTVVSPSVMFLGQPSTISFSPSSASVTSYVSVSMHGNETVQIACARIDYPGSACVFVPSGNATVANAFVRVIAYNQAGDPAVAVSALFNILNPAPSISNIAASTVAQGSSVTVPVVFSIGANSTSGVLSITTQPAHGSASIVNNAAIVFVASVSRNGPVSIGVSVCDNYGVCTAAVASITVTGVAPTLSNDAASTLQGKAVTVNVLANDAVIAAPLTVSSVQQPANGVASISGSSSITVAPVVAFFGVETFTYTACDSSVAPNCASATVTVSVTAVPPGAVDDAASTEQGVAVSIAVLQNDVVGAAPISSIAIVLRPVYGTVSFVGFAAQYTPSSSCWNGQDSFSYIIVDSSGQSSSAVVTVTLKAASVPVVQGDAYVVATGPSTLAVTANDPLAVRCGPWTLGITAAPRRSTVVVSGTSILLNSTSAQSEWFTYRVCDSSAPTVLCSASANVTVVSRVSTTAFASPLASSLWPSNSLQNVSFSQTLGAGSFFEAVVGSVAPIVLPVTSLNRVSFLARMPATVGPLTIAVTPVGQPARRVAVSFQTVAASITSVSVTSRLTVGTTATVSWKHNLGSFETGFSVSLVCGTTVRTLASDLPSTRLSVTWTVAGPSPSCFYRVQWQTTTAVGATFRIQ